jgi:carboxypeptidase C (cathepsin A)
MLHTVLTRRGELSSQQKAQAPVILWLNGGSGPRSSTGLRFELGPCSDFRGRDPDPYSWANNANTILFIHPLNVGVSYGDGNATVNSNPIAGNARLRLHRVVLEAVVQVVDPIPQCCGEHRRYVYHSIHMHPGFPA